jgi:hypothetical protein
MIIVFGSFEPLSMEATMVQRQKHAAFSVRPDGGALQSLADKRRPSPGTEGWHAVISADGSTTLWRRRGRIASVSAVRHGD